MGGLRARDLLSIVSILDFLSEGLPDLVDVLKAVSNPRLRGSPVAEGRGLSDRLAG